ncbi:glycosyltransferase family 2 protein [Rhizobium sp.]|uniref:glycosyltransferase family 2 protein n=1 Tax=Rhizobium sp. TaxID=391 RepID=UPI002EF10BCB
MNEASSLAPLSSEEPLVSIIIPVKNGLPTFNTVVDMVRAQELDAPFEVIVIDSGSKDGSKQAIPADDPRFRLIEIDPKSFGHGKTRNLGVQHSRGKFCAFLTHDAVPMDKYWLAELIKPLREDDDVAGVFGRHVASPGASPFTKWELEAHFGGLNNWPRVKLDDAREYFRNEGLRQVYHFYSDNSSCLRKSVWERFPYPDVNFAEDQLWAKTIVEAGYTKAFAWNSVVAHSHEFTLWERVQRSFDEASAFRRYFGYRICASKKQGLRRAVFSTIRDFRNAVANGWIWKYPILTLLMPFDNCARQIGHYLGTTRSDTARHVQLLSRDQKIQAQ